MCGEPCKYRPNSESNPLDSLLRWLAKPCPRSPEPACRWWFGSKPRRKHPRQATLSTLVFGKNHSQLSHGCKQWERQQWGRPKSTSQSPCGQWWTTASSSWTRLSNPTNLQMPRPRNPPTIAKRCVYQRFGSDKQTKQSKKWKIQPKHRWPDWRIQSKFYKNWTVHAPILRGRFWFFRPRRPCPFSWAFYRCVRFFSAAFRRKFSNNRAAIALRSLAESTNRSIWANRGSPFPNPSSAPNRPPKSEK